MRKANSPEDIAGEIVRLHDADMDPKLRAILETAGRALRSM